MSELLEFKDRIIALRDQEIQELNEVIEAVIKEARDAYDQVREAAQEYQRVNRLFFDLLEEFASLKRKNKVLTAELRGEKYE